jgi:hypothetical protein
MELEFSGRMCSEILADSLHLFHDVFLIVVKLPLNFLVCRLRDFAIFHQVVDVVVSIVLLFVRLLHTGKNTRYRTDDIGVDELPYRLQEDRVKLLDFGSCWEITISNRENSLNCPVETTHVNLKFVLVQIAEPHHPIVSD